MPSAYETTCTKLDNHLGSLGGLRDWGIEMRFATGHGPARLLLLAGSTLAVGALMLAGLSPAHASGVVASSSGREATAVITPPSYVAWRAHFPTGGGVRISWTGADTGDGYSFWINSVDPNGVGCPTAGYGWNPLVQVALLGHGVHENAIVTPGVSPDVGAPGITCPAGDYYIVGIFGGGTAPVSGAQTVTVVGPEGASFGGFSSGPALDLTDADFAGQSDSVIDTPAARSESVHGTVSLNVTGAMFGDWYTFNPSAVMTAIDPSGSSRTGNGGWSGTGPGTYSLRLDEDVAPTVGLQQGTGALLADVFLP